MAETTLPDYPRGLTFETVWAAIQANAEQAREESRLFREELDRYIQEGRELRKETDRQIKKTSRQMGDLHNRFGELAEHLVAPGIIKRFNELGYHFESILPGGRRILDENGKIKTEIDLLLENEDSIIAVEVKTKPVVQDVGHHTRRLEILREHLDKRHDGRKIYGAIAGAIFGMEEKKAAREAGLYVIEQSGDTMKMDVPDDFVPRKW